MEPQDGDSGGNEAGVSRAQWTFMKTRAALAVALIKNKPPDMTARQYAASLADKLRKQDEDWRRVAEERQQEVLRLRQELLLSRATASDRSTAETAAPDDTMDVSQDLFGSDSETPELLLEEPQPAITPPQPPPPPPLPSFNHLGRPSGNAVLPHVQFLQSLCALHRADGDTRGPEALWFPPDGVEGSLLLVDTICQLLDSVVAACRDRPPPLRPRDVVLQACQVAAEAMDLFFSQRLPSAAFKRHVEEALRELTATLLHCNQLGRLEAAERLMEYLITLGSSSLSKPFLLRHVLAQISALADQLWQLFQGKDGRSAFDGFPVAQYQNSCRLFGILEELLQTEKVPCWVEEGSEEAGFLSHLEERLFFLSHEFPLFSIYMWRVGGFLTPRLL